MLTAYGVLQADLHNLPEALGAFEDALDLCCELGDPAAYWAVWNNVSGVCASAALADIALSAAEIAIRHAEGIHDTVLARKSLALSLSNIVYATLFSASHGLGLRSAKRANEILEGLPVLRDSPHAEPELAVRLNTYCCQARHFLRVGSLAHARNCIELAKALAREFAPLGRAKFIVESSEALCLVYAGDVDEGMTRLGAALRNARVMTSELVTDALRNLIEASNIANRGDDSSEHMHELSRHMRKMRSDNTLFHYRRHLRFSAGPATSSRAAESGLGNRPWHLPARRRDQFLRDRSQVLEDLCAAAELHDDPSGRHPHRVAELARSLALKCGLCDEESGRIANAARLHDVGKIGVPPEVLRKAGPLNSIEMEVMRSHTNAGADLLASTETEDLLMAAAVARHHHEWWSGAGYPDGLAGESIPFAARIAALAEAFDAMTHHRVYRPKLTIRRAIELIAERAGQQFDPALANKFCELVLSLYEANSDLDAHLERNVRPSAFPRSTGRLANQLNTFQPLR